MNMDDEKNDGNDNKSIEEDVLLPGFRFHPTDEELVGFYLKKKIQHRTLPIELIKQVDIYKYDPWDLPKLASTGEKEMYFYCPRDRKYRNSTRPNRVTGTGFWKATGTDRPIYSSEGNKCIGLKKSLVFYRGRAAKGMKTDWMMHEFRLPSLSDSAPSKKLLDRNFPTNDSWAICRIFKKTNSMAQRALSQSWFSISPETISTDDHMLNQGLPSTQFSPENLSCTSEAGSTALAPLLCSNNNTNLRQGSSTSSTTMAHATLYNPSLFRDPNRDFPANFMFSQFENIITDDGDRISENIDFGGPQIQFNDILPIGLLEGMQEIRDQEVLGLLSSAIGFPFVLPVSDVPETIWKPNQTWDSSPGPGSEMSTSYSTNKC